MKTCAACKRELQLDRFDSFLAEGRMRYRSYCRDCHKVRERGRPRKRDPEHHGKSSPEKIAARRITNRAIRLGVLVRQPCERCGAEPTHAHHEDYSRPLAVRWLCHSHHVEAHWTPADTPLVADVAAALGVSPEA